jgi:hypothetical protein
MRVAVRWGVVLFAVACAPAIDQGEMESGDLDALERGCAPQTWPIDEQGHQAERVTILDGPGRTTWWVPPDPRGLVVMLHSNKHDSRTMFTIEHEELYNELAERNIAYVAVSNTGGVWSLSAQPDNRDYVRVRDVLDRVIHDTPAQKSTPLFAVGFSGGSMFAPVFAQLATDDGLDVRGFSSHNTGPRSTALVPAWFTAHANDNPNVIEGAYEDQLKRGLETEYVFLEESRVEPLRFSKEPNITEDESLLFFEELVDMGLIDRQGRRLVEEIGAALDDFQRNSVYEDSNKARDQLSVLWRRHIFSADRACAEAEFFDKQL